MWNLRIQADLCRWEHQWTSTHMHVFKSDGEPLKIDHKVPQPDKDTFERTFKLNFSGRKKAYHHPICLERYGSDMLIIQKVSRAWTKKRNMVLNKHIRKRFKDFLRIQQFNQCLPWMTCFFIIHNDMKKVTAFFPKLHLFNLKDSVIFLDYVLPFMLLLLLQTFISFRWWKWWN